MLLFYVFMLLFSLITGLNTLIEFICCCSNLTFFELFNRTKCQYLYKYKDVEN
jgi:hypothetical protein